MMGDVGDSRRSCAASPHAADMLKHTRSTTMHDPSTLDGYVITKREPTGALNAGADRGRLFINDAQTGVMAWWSMGRWGNLAARESVIACISYRMPRCSCINWP